MGERPKPLPLAVHRFSIEISKQIHFAVAATSQVTFTVTCVLVNIVISQGRKRSRPLEGHEKLLVQLVRTVASNLPTIRVLDRLRQWSLALLPALDSSLRMVRGLWNDRVGAEYPSVRLGSGHNDGNGGGILS